MAIQPTTTMQPAAAYALLRVGIVPPSLIAKAIIPKSFNNHRLHEMLDARLNAQSKNPVLFDYNKFWVELATRHHNGSEWSILATMTPEERLENPEKWKILRQANHERFVPFLLNFYYYEDLQPVNVQADRVDGFAFDSGFYLSSEETKFMCQKFNRMFQRALKRHHFRWKPTRCNISDTHSLVVFEAIGLEVK